MEKIHDFESSLNELQDIVSTIESGECSLEEAIALFEKGIELSNNCTKPLNEAKQRIITINEKTGDSTDE